MMTRQGKYLPHILILAIVSLGAFMDGLDGAIVNVALPFITGDFHADIGIGSLVITIYLVALSGLMILFGKVSSIYGTKKVFIAGTAVFTFASLLCAVSWDISSLIAFRFIQGAGAAMIAPSAVATVAVHMPGSERAKSLGILAAASALAFAIGPVLGGFLTEFFSWHWIFLINIPIGIITIAGAVKILPGDIPCAHKLENLDCRGAILFFSGMASLVVPLSFAGDKDISLSYIAIPLILSFIFFVSFVYTEKNARDPLIRLQMFFSRNFTYATMAYTFFMIAYGGVLLLLPFYFEGIQNLSAGSTGLLLLIPSAVITVTSPSGGYYADKYGARKICAASAVLFFLSILMISFFGVETVLPYTVLSLALMGLGGGPFLSAGSSRIIEHSEEEDREIASGIMSTAIYFGTGLGTALFTAIFSFFSASDSTENVVPSDFLSGFDSAMYFGILCCLIVVVFSLLAADKNQGLVQA